MAAQAPEFERAKSFDPMYYLAIPTLSFNGSDNLSSSSSYAMEAEEMETPKDYFSIPVRNAKQIDVAAPTGAAAAGFVPTDYFSIPIRHSTEAYNKQQYQYWRAADVATDAAGDLSPSIWERSSSYASSSKATPDSPMRTPVTSIDPSKLSVAVSDDSPETFVPMDYFSIPVGHAKESHQTWDQYQWQGLGPRTESGGSDWEGSSSFTESDSEEDLDFEKEEDDEDEDDDVKETHRDGEVFSARPSDSRSPKARPKPVSSPFPFYSTVRMRDGGLEVEVGASSSSGRPVSEESSEQRNTIKRKRDEVENGTEDGRGRSRLGHPINVTRADSS